MQVIDESNFDFLRFLFASFVIVSHSFDLLNQNDAEWLRVITRNQISFSTIGLMGFFCISGFLVFRSYENSKDAKHFLFKRFLRIFPGLFILLSLSILFCGIFITNLSLTEYFTSTQIWIYLSKNMVLFFMMPLDLPGSFTNNPYPNVVNGSLWTLPYEVIFYVFLSSLYFLKFLNRLWLLVLVWVYAYIMYLFFNNSNIVFPYTSFTLKHSLNFGLFFLSGVILSKVYDVFYKKFTNYIFAGLLILVVLTVKLNLVLYTYHLIFPFIYIYIALKPIRCIKDWGRFGDFSYGIYIYGFVVQQSIIFFLGNILTPHLLLAWSLLISALMGFTS